MLSYLARNVRGVRTVTSATDAAALLAAAEDGPVGPETMRLLDRIDPAQLDPADRVRLMELWARVESHATARKLEAVAAVADADVAGFADCEVAAALRLPAPSGGRLVTAARQLATALPRTAQALRDGELGVPHAMVVVESSYALPQSLLSAYEERILAKATTASPGQIRQHARRTVARLDPEGLARREREARASTDVFVGPRDDGASDITVVALPTVDAAIVGTAVDHWARSRKAQGDERTLGQLRGAALVDWASAYLTGPDAPRAHGRPVTVQVTIDAATLLGTADHPAMVGVDGMIPAGVARKLLDGARLRRLVTDPFTGYLLDYGRTTYRVPPDLAAEVAATYVTATGFGSTAPAISGDNDHGISWRCGGRTDRRNIHSPTRRWHRARTVGGWRLRIFRDRTVEWRSPLGRTYRVEPHDYRLGP